MDQELRMTLEEIKSYSLLAAKEYLTIEDVSLLTGYKVTYIRKLAHQGRLKTYKPFGKQVFFSKTEINQIIAASHVPSIAEIINR